MTNRTNQDFSHTDPLSPQLEQRLRGHFQQSYGPDSQQDAVWARIAPQLDAQPSSASPRWSGVSGWVSRLRNWPSTLASPRSIPRLSGLTVLLLLGLALGVWAYPTPLSAQQILAQAQAVHATPVVTSYHLQATQHDPKAASIQIEEWAMRGGYQREERTFYNAQGAIIVTQGTVRNLSQSWEWEYDPATRQTQVVRIGSDQPLMDSKEVQNPIVSLEDLLDGYSRKCQTAQYQGEGTFIGRTTYQIELVPNEQQCSPAAKPGLDPERSRTEQPGRRLLWLDQQTLVLLKWEQYSSDGTLQASYEVTSVEYDVAIPESTFTYEPPADATIITKPVEPAQGSPREANPAEPQDRTK